MLGQPCKKNIYEIITESILKISALSTTQYNNYSL